MATGYDPLLDHEPALARTMAASVQQRIAFGGRAGQQVRRLDSGFGDAEEQPALTGPRCASVHGFSLHTNTYVPAHRRDQLERLLRYTARDAVALERLEEAAQGACVYTFTTPWSNGTTGITFSPSEFFEKLAALVPLPRVHLVRCDGCLAPHSHLRSAITPTPRQQGVDGPEANTGSPRWSWVRLLKRVFAIDMARCRFCQRGSLRIIAAITQRQNAAERRVTLNRAVTIACGVALFFLLAGRGVLSLLGVSVHTFAIRSGMLLFATALPMLCGQRPGLQAPERDEYGAAGENLAIFPLAIPLLFGPGTIATMLLLADRARAETWRVGLLIVMTATVYGMAWLILHAGERVLTRLGQGKVHIITRVLGIVLAALAMQYVLNGFAQYYQSLVSR